MNGTVRFSGVGAILRHVNHRRRYSHRRATIVAEQLPFGARSWLSRYRLLAKAQMIDAKWAGYFAFLAFSALYFAQRALVAFEIFALAAADIVLFCVAPLGVMIVGRDE
jgi:hypothetical protein